MRGIRVDHDDLLILRALQQMKDNLREWLGPAS